MRLLRSILVAGVGLLPSLLLLTTGCLRYTQREELSLAVREFNDGIRWGNLDKSVLHLPLAAREQFQARYQGMEDEVQVVQYDVTRVDYRPEEDAATVRVDVEWSSRSQGLVLRTVVEQKWTAKHGGWMVLSQRRLKGAPLPLFDEKPAPATQAAR